MSSKPEADSVDIRVWVRRGGMLVSTSALAYDDPDHPYNQIKAAGLPPGDFGIEHPLHERFKNKSRAELIDDILALEARNVLEA